MSEQWRVYVLQPRASGREGKNLRLKAQPPAALRDSGVEPRRKTAGTDDPAEAQKAADAWARLLNSSAFSGEDPLVIDVIEKHLAWREAGGQTADSTLVAYRATLRRLRPLLAGTCTSELTRSTIHRVRDELLKGGLAAPTVNQTINCLRKAWRWAAEREWLTAPWPTVERLKTKPTEKRPMTDDEVEAILSWVASYRGGRWLPMFTLLADSGARIGEVLALRGGDVDRKNRAIRLGKTKTGDPRTLRPPAETIALLPEVAANELVFQAARPGCRRGKPLGGRVPLGVLWRALEALEIADAQNVDLHSFRRSWISSAHEEGVPLNVSMRATGHRSTRVHMDYARRATHDMVPAFDAVHARRQRARGAARPWEKTPPNTTPADDLVGAAKSSEFPLRCVVPASC